MLWLKSLLLSVLVTCAVSGSSQKQHLIYAEDTGNAIDFYKTDLNLESPRRLFILLNDGYPLESYFLIHNGRNNDVLYYSLQHSTRIGFYVISSGLWAETSFGNAAWKEVFLGPSMDGKLYFYNSDDRKIRLYDFDSGKNKHTLQEMTVMDDPNSKLSCFVRDSHKEQIFFVACSNSGDTGMVFDMKEKKLLETYPQPPNSCFDKCSSTPDDKTTYGLKDKELYMLARKNSVSNFTYYNFGSDQVESFAAGNNDVFYTTKRDGKIIKLTNIEQGHVSMSIPNYEIKGKVIALLIY